MVPGFVLLGALAVLFQLLVVVGFYGLIRYRRPIADSASRRRAVRVVSGGVGLAVFGQLAALGAVGSLRVTAVFSLEQAITLMNVGVLVALIGYAGVCGGFAIRLRAGE